MWEAQEELAVDALIQALSPVWLQQQVRFVAPTTLMTAWNEVEHAEHILTTMSSQ